MKIKNSGQFKKGMTPWNKGLHPEYLQGKNHPLYGKSPSDETREKMSQNSAHNRYWLGRKLSDKHKKAMSDKRKALQLKEEKSARWKGDEIGYSGLHVWVKSSLGKPVGCSNGSTHKAKRFVWANISGEYKRDLNDWQQLCNSCNKKDGVKIAERFQTV